MRLVESGLLVSLVAFGSCGVVGENKVHRYSCLVGSNVMEMTATVDSEKQDVRVIFTNSAAGSSVNRALTNCTVISATEWMCSDSSQNISAKNESLVVSSDGKQLVFTLKR